MEMNVMPVVVLVADISAFTMKKSNDAANRPANTEPTGDLKP
jgi:hypothetical protein